MQVKDETVKRKRGRPRRYADDGQEVSSRSSTPVQEVAGSSNVDGVSEQTRRGQQKQVLVEEPPVEVPTVEVPPAEVPMEERLDGYSRSSTPVQDEMVVEDMSLVQNLGSGIETVVIPSEQTYVESMTPVVVEQSVVQSEQTVEEMDVESAPVEDINIDKAHVTDMSVGSMPVEEMNVDRAPAEEIIVHDQEVTKEEPAVAEEPETETETDTFKTDPDKMVIDKDTAVTGSEDTVPDGRLSNMETDLKSDETEIDRTVTESKKERTVFDGGDFWKMLAAVPPSSEIKRTGDSSADSGEIIGEEQTEIVSSEIHDKPESDDKMEECGESSSKTQPSDIQQTHEVEMVEEETEKGEDIPVAEVTQQDQGGIQAEDILEESSSEKQNDAQEEESTLDDASTSNVASPGQEVEMEVKTDAQKDTAEEIKMDVPKDVEEKIKTDSQKDVAEELKTDVQKDLEEEINTDTQKDLAEEVKTDAEKDVTEAVESEVSIPPRPVVGHSPTPDEMPKEGEVDTKQTEHVTNTDEKVNESKDVESDLLAVPALGSSPTSVKIDDEEEEADKVESKKKETEKDGKKIESESKKEDDLVVPALGQSPTGSPTQGEKQDNAQKMNVDPAPSDLDNNDNPPTPTQDEPSSMDEISAAEGQDGEDKPAIPIYAVASPSKSPLGGLFLGRSVSQEGPSSSHGSPGAARSATEESSGAETNADSEESAPVIRETRQRPKRRVSTVQDADFEYSRPKRSRNETPPPPVLEPELPIERPKEEAPREEPPKEEEMTRMRTTRASKQKHISPPSTPQESRVRTRHQSSQSNESQQSARTPSPAPAERVTRARRGSRQSEDKQSHRYSDMVYYDTGRRSQRQQSASTSTAPVGTRRSSRRASDAQTTEKPTRGKRKR